MKKIYTILATAAILAGFAACTKVDADDTAASTQRISFEVANYVPQTKVQANNDELGGSFTTNAWFTNGDNTKMRFMNQEVISWNTNVSGQWAPAHEYFWPKTGYVDFYSYDGTQDPTTVDEGSLIYTDLTIASNDNILVADAAYRQNSNLSTYHIDASTVTGVPTLFRHQLAKIQFKVKVAHSPACTGTKWVVTILNATATPSNLVVKNQGTLTLSNSYTGTAKTTQAWTNTNTTNPNVGWVAGSTTETIAVDYTPVMTLAVNTTESSADPVALIDLRTVMPQVLGDDVVFTLNYNVKAYMGSETTPYIDENRVNSTTKLASLVTAITEWDMNKVITYNVIIDPVSERVLFDPAVEEWDETTSGTININD